MNATKFVVLLVIGVLCVNVSARVVEEVSKKTKLGTSISKTATKGIRAELSAQTGTSSYSMGYGYASASKSPKGPRADAYGSGYTDTNGYASAQSPKAAVSSKSGSSAQGHAAAAANRNGAAARGYGSAGSASTAKGSTSVKKGRKGKKN